MYLVIFHHWIHAQYMSPVEPLLTLPSHVRWLAPADVRSPAEVRSRPQRAQSRATLQTSPHTAVAAGPRQDRYSVRAARPVEILGWDKFLRAFYYIVLIPDTWVDNSRLLYLFNCVSFHTDPNEKDLVTLKEVRQHSLSAVFTAGIHALCTLTDLLSCRCRC